MTDVKSLDLGKKIKVFLVENDINQKDLAKYLKSSDSVLSDKLNGKVKISIDEFYLILHFLRSKSNIEVDANYFLPLTPLEISDTN